MKKLIPLLALAVTACGPVYVDRVVVKKEYVPITVSEPLLTRFDIPKPPAPTVFQAATEADRVSMLTDYSIELLKLGKMCNVRLEDIKQYQIRAAEKIKADQVKLQ